ncbi:hypothetical protein B0H15DRAFT_958867 [Mycena belliarum]|uniref:Uncharacterized protein n=1 Tax=Mycena belliarum TaxID=1033014 RepID=A0AAD6XH78_9AGAR|nr:hypothetical protein B0H15DRAFT_958867 [Mycena belliae]
MQGLVKTYNDSPLGQENPIDEDEFITFIKGMGTDHANDQKKLARLVNSWITNAHKIVLGKRFLLNTDLQHYLPQIALFNDEKIAAAGGLAAWNSLTVVEQTERDIEVCRKLFAFFGESEWQGLSMQQRLDTESLVWCGCCMHKEMNSVKGGVRGMSFFWETLGGPAPIKLFNKANDAAVSKSAAGSAVAEHAIEVSEGGAVKLTSLIGAAFNHKDQKKGQQDTFKLYFEEYLGYPISCPDTSNSRFQCHCDCAVFIILYLPQILDFMTHIMYSKSKIGLNHLEVNIVQGLKDLPTLTEMMVLALYAISVSYGVIAFCESISANPDLLLAPDASWKTGTLDGQPWEHPEVFYAIQRLATGLPHLTNCLKVFMTGAVDTWKRFGDEYAADGPIARLSPAARAKIYINPTNDHNEGALGRLPRNRNNPNSQDRHLGGAAHQSHKPRSISDDYLISNV